MKAYIYILLVVLLGVGWVGFRPKLQASTPATEQAFRFLADRTQKESLAPLTETKCVDGFAGIYPCNNIDLLAFLPYSRLGGGADGNDIWGWTDPETGNEYAVLGTRLGTAFVNVTDPVNPVYIGLLPQHASASFWDAWRDVKVYANHAYIVSENRGQGMQIFDLTQLRDETNLPKTFSNTAHYAEIGGSHNIFVNEESGYAYIIGAVTGQTCSGGLHMVNLANPTSPIFAGCFSADGYTHDVQCVNYRGPDRMYTEQEICFASNEDTLTIVNVSDKTNPVQISRLGYSGSSYAHQGWLTEDQQYFLMNDEGDEQNSGHNTRTYIWNVSDLDSPTMFATHTGPTPAIDHNLYIIGDLNYQANYASGLRILDNNEIGNGNLEEVAYFDTYPNSNANVFNGAWSVYPFFESGTLIVSGIDEGLFILRHNRLELSLLDSAEMLICDTDSITRTLQINPESASKPTTMKTGDLPSHVAAAFSPQNFSSSDIVTSTLSFTATNAAIGTYPVEIYATTEGFTASLGLTLTTSIRPVATPTYPITSTSDISPTFRWDVSTQGSYTIEISADNTFTSPLVSETITNGVFTPTVAFAPESTYYWRVTGSNVCGTVVSSTASFIRNEPFPFKQFLPIIIR